MIITKITDPQDHDINIANLHTKLYRAIVLLFSQTQSHGMTSLVANEMIGVAHSSSQVALKHPQHPPGHSSVPIQFSKS